MNTISIKDFEVFKFGDNTYTPFTNNGHNYLLNKEPYLDIVLTDHCNANCNFYIADLVHNKLRGDFEIFKTKVLYAIKYLNVKEVLLLGGEPTMSKMLIPMIKWLATLNLDKIVMTTNGIRLAQDSVYRNKVLSAGLTNINVSFMSIYPEKQVQITNSKYILTIADINIIYDCAYAHNVNMRINNNIFLGNNDSVDKMIQFYNATKDFCDSIKFSPLLPTDSFSVVSEKTKWNNEHILSNSHMLNLFNKFQEHYNNVSIIENNLQFGFVKNTMIPLKTPIILNWNFGNYTGMMDKVVKESKINNIKLLANNELSLSWNRESTEYYIKTI